MTGLWTVHLLFVFVCDSDRKVLQHICGVIPLIRVHDNDVPWKYRTATMKKEQTWDGLDWLVPGSIVTVISPEQLHQHSGGGRSDHVFVPVI